jgi:hypothetical protein
VNEVAAPMPLPNVIIAGAPKCGTTSLYFYLSDHPQVCSSAKKETKYLIDPGYPLFDPSCNFHLGGMEGYSSLFRHCAMDQDAVILEATPDYIYQKTPLEVLPEIVPRPTVLFVLRNPALRTYSLFRFAKNNMSVVPKNLTFKQFLKLLRNPEDPIFRGRTILRNAIVHGKYVDFLIPWIETLGRRSIYVTLFENFSRDPLTFMRRLCGVLNIDGRFYDSYSFVKKNVTYRIRSQTMHLMVKAIKRRYSSPRPPVVQILLQKLYGFFMFINSDESHRKITSEDAEVLSQLTREFQPFNDTLARLLGLDLTLWEYQNSLSSPSGKRLSAY